ncbi:hypothetical protein [Nonlabens marinus]|uniref:FeoB-associated Cys-rich membrane protein n=1 Tax=Nonlabens marinus S1-08 TaxID=1454201 RepID=W8VUJ1_9FLAO|nr:hypothetical protein [Nonlabens marinus]BAO54643.1 hypothetical protein NMS_0634 [Nonlabens marinus S1-08]
MNFYGLVLGLILARFRESGTTMIIFQYILLGLAVSGAVLWLFRKQLFPKKYKSGDCGDGDCGCH